MAIGLLGALVVFSATPVHAGESVPIEGDVDYLLNAHVHGSVVTRGQALLSAQAPEGGVPDLHAFAFTGYRVEATYLRNYGGVDLVVDGPDRVDLRYEDVPLDGPDVIQDREVYYDAGLSLIDFTQEWNVVAFYDPGRADVAVSLPEGDYAMANVPRGERLLRPDVPMSGDLSHALAGPAGTIQDRLKLTGDHVDALLQGDFYVLLYGSTFDLNWAMGSDRFVTGHHTEAYEDGHGTPTQRDVNAVVLLKVWNGRLSLLDAGGDVAVYAAQYDILGQLSFARTTGSLQRGDTLEQPRDEDVALDGQVLVAPRGAAYAGADGQPFGPVTLKGVTYASLANPPLLGADYTLALVGASALGAGAAVRWIPGVRRIFFAAVAGFSMVGKDDALDHRVRNQIFEYVRLNPGVTLSHVHRDLSLGWGTVEYHVGVLERLRLMVTKRVGAKRLLFCNGHSRLADPVAWSLLQNTTVRRLAHAFPSGAPFTQQQAAAALACSPQYAGRLLRKLEDYHLVAPLDDARRGRTYRTATLLVELEQRIAAAPEVPVVQTASLGPTPEPVVVSPLVMPTLN